MSTLPTAREWLAARNLAKPGTRGIFSKEAKAALVQAMKDGVQFADWNEQGRIKSMHTPRKSAVVVTVRGQEIEVMEEPRVERKPIPPSPRRREETIVKITDHNGTVTKLDHCQLCTRSVQKCGCKNGPHVNDFLRKDAKSIELIAV